MGDFAQIQPRRHPAEGLSHAGRGERCRPFDPANATLADIRAEITRLYDMELRELNECHEGPADWYRFEIRRLERLHFERCYRRTEAAT